MHKKKAHHLHTDFKLQSNEYLNELQFLYIFYV